MTYVLIWIISCASCSGSAVATSSSEFDSLSAARAAEAQILEWHRANDRYDVATFISIKK